MQHQHEAGAVRPEPQETGAQQRASGEVEGRAAKRCDPASTLGRGFPGRQIGQVAQFEREGNGGGDDRRLALHLGQPQRIMPSNDGIERCLQGVRVHMAIEIEQQRLGEAGGCRRTLCCTEGEIALAGRERERARTARRQGRRGLW